MKKGYLTVYLSLTLAIILSFIFSMVEGARSSAIRLQIETAADMGLDSIFAEYNRELLSQYDLFFIDTSYGLENGSVYQTAEHLKEYMSYHFKPETNEIFQFLYKDFYDLSISNIEVEEAAFATDQTGEVYKRQAISYMKDVYGISYFDALQDQMKTVSDKNMMQGDIEQDIQKNIKKVKKKYEKKKKDKELEEHPDESKLEEYTDIFDDIHHKGILSLVTSNEASLSNQSVQLSQYVSKRKRNSGCGLTEEMEKPEPVTGELIFGEYLLNKFGCYTRQKENSLLKYQIEYILYGKNTDLENLKAAVNTLLQLRAASNLMYLYSDQTKKNEIDLVATLIAAALTIPEAKDLVALVLTLIWAYAEAIVDIRILLEQGKVPLMKNSNSWNLGLLHLKDAMHKKSNKEAGLSYEDYLRIFLGLMNKSSKVYRSMDVIEMDIRQTQGNHHFRMDQCIDYLAVRIAIVSGYGPQYLITRRYRYF